VTGGNPFLVAESLAAGGGLPASVRDATLARVGRLAPSARGVVDAAAVIGQRVAPGLLARVAPHLPGQVEGALACGVLVQEGEVLGFRHELTRQAIEQSISAPRRAELHARVVTALTESEPVIDHARVAHHAERAGLGVEGSRHATLAAAEAERIGALREAGLQLERALRLGADADPRERFGLLLRLARVTNFEGRMEESLATVREAVAIAERHLGSREHGRALNQLVASLWSLDRFAEARDTALEAIAVLETVAEPAELARAHAAHLRVQAVAFDPAAVIASVPRALELAARAGMAEAEIDIRISLAVARSHRGEPGVREQLDSALADARAAGLHIQTIRAIVNIIVAAADARDHATVEERFAPAMSLVDHFQAEIPRAAIVISTARSRFDRGRWDDALVTAAPATRVWFGEVPVALAVEGLIRARRGDPGAGAVMERAWAGVAAIPEGWRHATIRAALAEVAWLRGDGAALRRILADARASPFGHQMARPASELALWAMRAGERFEAPEHVLHPVALELAGDWRAAIAAWRQLPAPYEAALASLRGDDAAAREAMTALRRLGAVAGAAAFARERAARGGPSPRGPRRSTLAHPAGLTRREQEVLEQLAGGATNPGIAAALHLSERTVAHHVAAILSKLGVPTRTAAVQAARTAGLLKDGPDGGSI
jgi:DNA-binding CsgD family transcriptional regulator/tetratricopeptide (TPR) repeat protein